MEIVRAEVMGVCFGVRRAMECAEAALHAGHQVSTLGPLVHNPQETARLARLGIRAVDVPEDCTGTVVIRAHGARPDVFAALRAGGRTVVDATCPFVRKSQQIACQFADAGHAVIIVGHPDHPEVQGILGYIRTPAYVISQLDDVANLPPDLTPGVIAQTTFNENTFGEIARAITRRYPATLVHDTVCSATRDRQDAARTLATRVEAVYVIGGRASSNTNRLAEICRELCPTTFLIETADEIIPADLHGITRVGVTAGASTPDWLIDEVVARLRGL